jgi:hypothetical protein
MFNPCHKRLKTLLQFVACEEDHLEGESASPATLPIEVGQEAIDDRLRHPICQARLVSRRDLDVGRRTIGFNTGPLETTLIAPGGHSS